MRTMSKWVKIQNRVTDEPYPTHHFICEECEISWEDDEEEKCLCDSDEEEDEGE